MRSSRYGSCRPAQSRSKEIPEVLSAHDSLQAGQRLDDVEAQRADGQVVDGRAQAPGPARVVLPAVGDDAGEAVHDVGVGVQAQCGEQAGAGVGVAEGEVEAVVPVDRVADDRVEGAADLVSGVLVHARQAAGIRHGASLPRLAPSYETKCPIELCGVKTLILGGSTFVGRRMVDLLVRDGHAVSVLNRGRTASDLPDGRRRASWATAPAPSPCAPRWRARSGTRSSTCPDSSWRLAAGSTRSCSGCSTAASAPTSSSRRSWPTSPAA